MKLYSLLSVGLLTIVAISGCSQKNERKNDSEQVDNSKVTKLEKQMQDLLATNTQINALIESDFKDCKGLAQTSDPLVNKICKIAEAATVEAKVEMKSELGALSRNINTQLLALKDQLARVDLKNRQQDIAINNINTQITNIVNNFNTAIANLSTPVTGTMKEIEIGKENLGAGPFYESVLISLDRKRLNAIIEAYYPDVALSLNAMTTTAGSSNVIVYSYNHDMVAGNVIEMYDVLEGNGLTKADLSGQFAVKSVVDSDHFVIQLERAASVTGVMGGSVGNYRRLLARETQTVWKDTDGPSGLFRTSWGSRGAAGYPYNYIVKSVSGVWSVCYDRFDATATFATIDALGPTVVCK